MITIRAWILCKYIILVLVRRRGADNEKNVVLVMIGVVGFGILLSLNYKFIGKMIRNMGLN